MMLSIAYLLLHYVPCDQQSAANRPIFAARLRAGRSHDPRVTIRQRVQRPVTVPRPGRPARASGEDIRGIRTWRASAGRVHCGYTIRGDDGRTSW
ncbi:hypothetical protein [Frankia sp. CcWB3]